MSHTQRVPVLACAWLIACAPRASTQAPRAATPEVLDAFTGFLIQRATPVLDGEPGVAIDMAIERSDADRWRIRAVGQLAGVQASDTIDAHGLYLHDGMLFPPPARRSSAISVQALRLKPGARPMFTLRTGPSPASDALWVSHTGPKQLTAEENRPAGAPAPIAGCYRFEGGAQERLDSLARDSWGRMRVRIPAQLRVVRLHWQFLWRAGRDSAFVATDGAGFFPEEYYHGAWYPRGDTANVFFAETPVVPGMFQFRLRPDGDAYIATFRPPTDDLSVADGLPDLEARMLREQCQDID